MEGCGTGPWSGNGMGRATGLLRAQPRYRTSSAHYTRQPPSCCPPSIYLTAVDFGLRTSTNWRGLMIQKQQVHMKGANLLIFLSGLIAMVEDPDVISYNCDILVRQIL
jgi:hypothetical protein